MHISSFLIKYPELKPIYDILKPYLLKDIYIHGLDELGEVRSTVLACALPPDKLFFRYIPPDPVTFAHELIHLCRKPKTVPEEVYGYNLAQLVVFMAEQGIKANPFKLFELSEREILKVLEKYGYKYIEEFYEVQGVIPTTHDLEWTEQGLRITRKTNDEKTIVVTFVSELIAGIPYFEVCRSILLDLLKL